MVRGARLLLVVASTAVLAGCGGDDGTKTTGSTQTATAPATTTAPASTARTVAAYFVAGEKVAPVARDAAKGTAVGRAAIEALLAGPTSAERAAGLTSAIPAGTKLLGLTIRDGLATVDFDAAFQSGGGSLSMNERVAQVVHTLTRFPTVQKVAFRIDGKPVAAIGGEGVVVDPPVDRNDFEAYAPQILIESPLRGETVTSPLRITGTANTFEANFIARVLGPDGRKLAEHFVTATSGSGTRGTFSRSLSFEAAPGTRLTLYAFEASAQDGRPIHEVRVPLVAG